MSVALRAGCQRAHKVLMKMGETVVRNGDGLDTGHWTGAVGCVVILAQKHCILLKRTFAQPWILAGLGICSFAHCSCAHALISLKTNE